jgi:hypothetical protein
MVLSKKKAYIYILQNRSLREFHAVDKNKEGWKA